MSITDDPQQTELILMGAGGHAREIRDIVEEIGRLPLLRVVEFRVEVGHLPADEGLAALGYPVREGPPDLPIRGRYVSAVGDPTLRRRLSLIAETGGLVAQSVVSAHACVRAPISERRGAVVFPLAFISSNVHVGDHVHVNAGSTVSHDVTLDEYVTVGPGSRICGGVHIAAEAMLGAGAVVLPGVYVGRGSRVGAGAVVTRDVPDGVVVAGVPARDTRRSANHASTDPYDPLDLRLR